ncbi:sulfurtransferase TusA family protein [Devosia sp. RR2S18]|uniref:sulfurtransferase TusA family protein n=1 Tax=Devosia rhizosphaerae TaxID=3049774 RepID=UPI002540EDDF|nr:sulfurtransferase TusA family protein [Devosia sp. RR2S18]WIJ25639.1 sulfurtransferase TusA family protein [Devosia sp. RR2S18]
MTISPEVIDARGLKCPLPVLKLEKRIQKLPAGSVLTVLATDPMARIDIPLYCRQHAHGCELAETEAGLRFTIVAGSA